MSSKPAEASPGARRAIAGATLLALVLGLLSAGGAASTGHPGAIEIRAEAR